MEIPENQPEQNLEEIMDTILGPEEDEEEEE